MRYTEIEWREIVVVFRVEDAHDEMDSKNSCLAAV